MCAHEKVSLRERIAQEVYTYCAFCIAVSALPALALSYVVVNISKKLWLKLLSSRYPDLEFIKTDTVRSLLDTHRNQGIINVLLSVKGPLDVERIKNCLVQHVIDRRDKNGELMFPRMRQVLVSCWGNYAWDINENFRLENHVFMANAVYRGRPVSENNIQEYVSNIVSKYFSNDQPPWQYIIIPCVSTEDKYYVLVRVHHLLLSGSKSINIGDLLLVQRPTTERMPSQDFVQKSPLTKLFPAPSAIPVLWEKLNENLSNTWNEFVSEYDPVESPRALKTLPGAFHVAGLILISSVSALRELTKKTNGRNGSDSPITATTLIVTIQRECKRRNLTVPKIVLSPLVTADPRKWPLCVLRTVLVTTRSLVKLPIKVRDELIALLELKRTGRVIHAHTMTWKYAEVAQLCVRATGEAWRGAVELYRAPAELWNDTVRADDGHRHLLQTVSLCGRKVAAWSRPVSRASVERAARALGVSTTDIALYATTEAVRAFLENSNSTPDVILTTARAATEDFLFAFAEGQGRKYQKSQTGGMICLSLPVGATPRRIASVVEQACSRQGALAGAWAVQARCGALTRAIPSPLARLTLNVLSRKYAVSYAEINARPDMTTRSTLWGQTVDAVIYWRPPQANISMSLTIIQYADTIRLAVMTDARLSPSHGIPATRWPVVVDQLIAKVDQEIARIAAHSSIPTIVTTQVNTEDNEPIANSSTGALRPPAPTIVSPPPMRRRITHN